MKNTVVIFTAAFLVGALAALAARTAMHKPYMQAPATSAASAPAPMVDDIAAETGPPHTNATKTETTPATTNTICPVCGMPVDPSLPTALYDGKVVGFGCRACPPKFSAAPDTYGPAALRNQTVE